MRILVTGANGFIGSSFVSFLSRQTGFDVAPVVRHLPLEPTSIKYYQSDYSSASLSQIVASFRPEWVIHAAGSASVKKSVEDQASDRASSVELLAQVLGAFREATAPPPVLFISSASVYGNPEHLPISENDRLDPISPYGTHRLACEQLIAEYGQGVEQNCLVVRAFSLFGAAQKQLVLWETAKQAITCESIILQGTGNELRDFLSIEEFIQRCLRLMTAERSKTEIINVAAGESISIHSLAEKTLSLLQIKRPIITLNRPQNGNPTSWAASIARYRQLTGDLTKPDLNSDLKLCLEAWLHELM